jgi:hypothetical protein
MNTRGKATCLACIDRIGTTARFFPSHERGFQSRCYAGGSVDNKGTVTMIIAPHSKNLEAC